MASYHPFRVLEEFQVPPPPGSVAQSTLPLALFDVPWLFAHPVERLLFYRFTHPTAYFTNSVLQNLRSSLSLTLQHFYPLSGNLKRSPHYDDKFEICYREGDAVCFTLAEYDQDFEELSECQTCDSSKILPLVPQLTSSSDAKPLLAIQVTLFPGRGICIGVAIHHVVCDGLSSIHFLKSWASACRSRGLAPLVGLPPIHDRTLIADPHGLCSTIYKQMTENRTSKPAGSSGNASGADVVFSVFTLRSDKIQRLKKIVAAAVESKSLHCSTFVVSLAFVWVCLVKTQGYEQERTAHIIFVMDCKALLNPPVPVSYFGNCVRPCFVDVKIGELITKDGILTASEAIGKAIKGSKEEVLHGAEGWNRRIRSIAPERALSIAGSPKFRVYETDFGWGRPLRVEIPSIQGTGAISMAESRDEEGSVEIGLALPKQEMDKFEAHFCYGLQQI